VLKPGGRLILSVNHPLVRVFTYPDEDYFATRQYSEDYEFAGEEVTLTHWHRPLHGMINAFTAAEFDITLVSETTPSPNTPVEFLTPASVAARQLRSYRSSSSCSELAESIINPQLDRAVATHDSTQLCPFRAWQASS